MPAPQHRTSTLADPEYRVDDVLAGPGNLSENDHAGPLLVDLEQDCVGLHANGRARSVKSEDLLWRPGLLVWVWDDCKFSDGRGRSGGWWSTSSEAYVHWCTDGAAIKSGNLFGAPSDRSGGE